jgi:hypothetical protein
MGLHVSLSLASMHLLLVELDNLSRKAVFRLIEDSKSLSCSRALHGLLLVIRERGLRVFET